MRNWMLTVGLLAGLWTVAGCQQTQYASPLVTEYDQGRSSAELNFWHGLAEQPITTNNDAFHGLIEWINGHDPHSSYQARVRWLTSRNYLDDGFDQPADAAVQRGSVAQIVCRTLNIQGGLTMRLIGAHPRYATRELVYLDIMETGTPQQALSGIQFVSAIGKARDYQETQ